MNEDYEKFLKEFDELLSNLFEQQKKYIKCKKGCSKCCQNGDYPMSQLEFRYLTQGYINLPTDKKILVQNNMKKITSENQKDYQCPFLINNECCIYEYRGIICRTFGICYFDDENKYVRLPQCVYEGLNYSEYFDKKESILKINDVPQINLRTDKVFESELAKKYKLDCGEIRPLIKWVKG